MSRIGHVSVTGDPAEFTHGRIVFYPGQQESPFPSCIGSPCEGCASCRPCLCRLGRRCQLTAETGLSTTGPWLLRRDTRTSHKSSSMIHKQQQGTSGAGNLHSQVLLVLIVRGSPVSIIPHKTPDLLRNISKFALLPCHNSPFYYATACFPPLCHLLVLLIPTPTCSSWYLDLLGTKEA